MVSPLPDIRTRVLALNTDALAQRYTVDGPTIRGAWKFDDPTWKKELAAGGASRRTTLTIRLEPTTATFHVTESPARGASLDVAGAVRDMMRRRTRVASGGAKRGAPATTPGYTAASIGYPIIGLLEADGWINRGMPLTPPKRFTPPTRTRR